MSKWRDLWKTLGEHRSEHEEPEVLICTGMCEDVYRPCRGRCNEAVMPEELEERMG